MGRTVRSPHKTSSENQPGSGYCRHIAGEGHLFSTQKKSPFRLGICSLLKFNRSALFSKSTFQLTSFAVERYPPQKHEVRGPIMFHLVPEIFKFLPDEMY